MTAALVAVLLERLVGRMERQARTAAPVPLGRAAASSPLVPWRNVWREADRRRGFPEFGRRPRG